MRMESQKGILLTENELGSPQFLEANINPESLETICNAVIFGQQKSHNEFQN